MNYVACNTLLIFPLFLIINLPYSSILIASPFIFPLTVSISTFFPIVDDLFVHSEIIFLV